MARSILLVDDDDRFRVLAAEALRAAGFDRVYEATTAADGRAQAIRRRPDAALVDVGLPDGDGLELARDLAALTDPPRIVLTSANGDAADDDAAQRAGAAGFVAKEELDGTRLRGLFEAV